MCDYYNVEKTVSSGELQRITTNCGEELRRVVVKVDYRGVITETDLDPSMKYFSQKLGYENGPILAIDESCNKLYKDGILVSSGKPVKYAVYPVVVYESGDLYDISDEPVLLDTDIVHVEQLPTGTLSIRKMARDSAMPGQVPATYYQVGLIGFGMTEPLEWFSIDSLLCTGPGAFAGRVKAGGPVTVWGMCWDVKINSGLIKNGLLCAAFDKEVVDVATLCATDENMRILVKSLDEGTYFHYADKPGWAYDDALKPSEFRGRHGNKMFVTEDDDGYRYLCDLCAEPFGFLVVGRLIG